MWISDFGLRLNHKEVNELIVEYLGSLGYVVNPKDISVVVMTNGKIEFVIRHFLKN